MCGCVCCCCSHNEFPTADHLESKAKKEGLPAKSAAGPDSATRSRWQTLPKFVGFSISPGALFLKDSHLIRQEKRGRPTNGDCLDSSHQKAGRTFSKLHVLQLPPNRLTFFHQNAAAKPTINQRECTPMHNHHPGHTTTQHTTPS